MSIRIRNENSNFLAEDLQQIARWAKEECYNDLQRSRQAAAKKYLVGGALDGGTRIIAWLGR